MKEQLLFDGSARSRCPIAMTTRHSRIGISRHRVDGTIETLTRAPAQDAHLVIVQLAEQPAHDFWADGRHLAVPDSNIGTLSIIDMNRRAEARFRAELDSIHIHVPRQALDDLATDAASGRVESLVVPDRWTVADWVAQQISPLLVAALYKSEEATQPYVDHLMLAITTHVATAYGGFRPQAILPRGLAPWQIRRAQEMLAMNLGGEMSLNDIATACGLSVSYFSRAFKVSTGVTPIGGFRAGELNMPKLYCSTRCYRWPRSLSAAASRIKVISPVCSNWRRA